MFDSYEPFLGIQKQSFTFQPNRYEIWMDGKMSSSGRTTFPIVAKVIHVDKQEKVEIRFGDVSLINELATLNIYDEFITAHDRLQLITIPAETDSQCIGLVTLQTIIGSTCQRKIFKRNESYCCNLFTVKGSISKITFSFSNPEKLIEFYSNPDEDTLQIDFLFKSSDHIRYQNGRHVSGPHGGAGRAIKVEPNIKGGEGYTVTIFNLDGNHPTWQTNIQMTPKQMKIVRLDNNTIELKGYGKDEMGSLFADYGLTIHHNNGQIEKCILHMYDRGIDIEYLS